LASLPSQPGSRQPVKFLIALLALGAWIALAGNKTGPLPPLGKFLSPFQGFWRNAAIGDPDDAASILPQLGKSSARTEFDRRGVPHVFATDYQALFFAQGYVTARDRLWQMDAQSRAGLGRLAEVMGPDLLPFDLERRRMGFARAVQADW
jgi:penicillin amidase